MLNASQQVDQQVVRNADEAAAAALRMAMLAAGQGTFAVGGLIVHNGTGEVIHAMHNSVLRKLPHGKGFTWDPTAHGERQLVYWYFENRAARSLPPPSELTIVTSLDPCVMCTGAILAAGFNVGVVALDDYAGINWNKRFQLTSLPDKLRAQASKSFGYYACGNPATDPRGYVRKYEGGAGPVFHADRVAAHNLLGCDLIFRDSANAVRDLSSKESGVEPKDLKDPASLPEDSPIKQAYRRIYPNAFKIKNAHPRMPQDNVIAELKRVAGEGTEGNGNAVAFLDPFGNVILCLPGREKVNPARAPFMEVTQAYAQTRWELMNSNADFETTMEHLTVPKYGTFVFLHAPEPHEATGIMTLGAYGSTMEGPVPRNFPANLQYVHAPRSGTLQDLTAVISALPPLYTDLVQIAIGLPAGSEALPAAPLVFHPAPPAFDRSRARNSAVYLNKARNSRF